MPEEWVIAELRQSIERGRAGDGASARRAAELFELLDDFGQAVAWWRRAAELGDPDAIDYVNYIIRG